VSRGAFRSSVEAPRPASAWAMVAVASATLWITGQLDVWAMALQALAIVVSLARREQPHPWQKSPVALNVGMFGVVIGTVVVALRGPPSTIALAHFAALTQGLQLLDARPRRTEFLLVALALFQVILAANLTDSVFFTPLLVAFLLAAVWTLLVHTLRSEAIEAGDARAVSQVLTPALLRTTLFASGLCVLLALVLFVALPRMRGSVLTSAARAGAQATAGFSDQVQLGDLGRIRQDPTVVLRVETLEGEAPPRPNAFWRGLAFDHFDGRSWSVTPSGRRPVPGSPEGGVSLGPGPEDANLVQRIVREPVVSGTLFGAGQPRALQGTIRRLERDATGGLYAAGQSGDRVRYTISTRRRSHADAELADDRTAPPPRSDGRYLQLPEISERVRALAREVTRGSASDAERVRALERWLLANGRYTDSPPPRDATAALSPVESFLMEDTAGHCEYFASAMVVLARSAGIPARLVNGFAGGRTNRIGGFVEVTRSDAHAWVEVHYADAGWVRYDPTPPDLRTRSADVSWDASLGELASALELWWFRRVVDFDRSDQMRVVKAAWLQWRRVRPGGDRSDHDGGRRIAWRPEDLSAAWLPLAAIALAAAAVAWARRGRGAARRRLPADYAAALRLLARRGLERDPASTARDFAGEVRREVPAPAGVAFTSLTERYLAARFGGRAAPEDRRALRELRRALGRGRRRR